MGSTAKEVLTEVLNKFNYNKKLWISQVLMNLGTLNFLSVLRMLLR